MIVIEYSPEIQQTEGLHALARSAATRLEEDFGPSVALLERAFGPSEGTVRAEWDRGEDAQGRPMVILRLSDYFGSVTGVFAPEELGQLAQLLHRLRRLWGELLQKRSVKQLERVLSDGGQETN